jgi:hypothetical protein
MDYESYLNQGIIRLLETVEKEKYILFHKTAYEDDIKVAEMLLTSSFRWAIIAGYYAMHDITKLYLAKHHNLKISEKGVHLAAVVALRYVLSDNEQKKKVLLLLAEAKKTYDIFSTPLKEKVIPAILNKGKEEREKTQYYSEEKINLEKSLEFQEKIVRPYVDIMKKMIGNDK